MLSTLKPIFSAALAILDFIYDTFDPLLLIFRLIFGDYSDPPPRRRKRPRRQNPSENTLIYEYQLEKEEAEQWLNNDPAAHQAWQKFKPYLNTQDTIYSYKQTPPGKTPEQGIAVLRRESPVWKHPVSAPFIDSMQTP